MVSNAKFVKQRSVDRNPNQNIRATSKIEEHTQTVGKSQAGDQQKECPEKIRVCL
jgi:hypothetical protein